MQCILLTGYSCYKLHYWDNRKNLNLDGGNVWMLIFPFNSCSVVKQERPSL